MYGTMYVHAYIYSSMHAYVHKFNQEFHLTVLTAHENIRQCVILVMWTNM